MKKHPILRALPLSRPLVKKIEQLEREREKLQRKVQRLSATVAERDARLQTLELSVAELQSLGKQVQRNNHCDPIAEPATPEDEDAAFAEVPVSTHNFEKPRFEKFPYAGPFPWLDCDDADLQIQARLTAGTIGEYEAEQFRCWKDKGYIILDRAIEPELLDEVWAAYEGAIAAGTVELNPEKIEADDPWPGRCQDPHMKVPAICRIMRHPKLLHWVRLLMEREPAPFKRSLRTREVSKRSIPIRST